LPAEQQAQPGAAGPVVVVARHLAKLLEHRHLLIDRDAGAIVLHL
jgi:hypothetical protein